ncbi:UNVERIFIED_ORG: hypothetical protein QFZ59_003038 [Bacillus sp. B2I3]|nr:hypothetical protein [Bacillus sp. B2I3]
METEKKELVVNTNHLVGYQCYLPCFIPYWTLCYEPPNFKHFN